MGKKNKERLALGEVKHLTPSGRTSGRNKRRQKAREYKAHVRTMILAGKVNNAESGAWVDGKSANVSDSAWQMAWSGCVGERVTV